MSRVVDYGDGSYAALPEKDQLNGGEMLCGGMDESLWRGADGKYYHVYREYDSSDECKDEDDIRAVTEKEAKELMTAIVKNYGQDEKTGGLFTTRSAR